MKKRTSWALTLLMAALLATGCTKGEDKTAYVGEWHLQSMTTQGVTIAAEDFYSMQGADEEDDPEVTVVLREDGTFETESLGQISYGTWKVEDGKAVIEASGDTMTATLQDGALVMQEGENSITFHKE